MKNEDYKISVITPTFNEEKNIEELIQSLLNQSYLPNEIIICDGGSTDKTIEKIRKFPEFGKIIKTVPRKNKCRGSGRNSAIESSNNRLIAMIDSGTRPNKRWLEILIDCYKKNLNAKVIFGSVKSINQNFVSRNLANIVFGKNNFDEKIVFSVSSLLIQKNVWIEVGKFPESENGEYVVEDLRFIDKIKKKAPNYLIEKDAVVLWKLPTNLKAIYSRFREFSLGAILNKYAYTWHYGIIRNYLVLLFIIFFSFKINSLIFVFLIPFIFLRSYKYLFKKKKYVNRQFMFFKDIFITSFLLFVIDLAAINGFIKYLFKKISKH